MTIFYPDVSSFQTGVSFAGCVIAVVKATEGTGYTNPDYAAAKVRAGDAGAYFCAYHFLHEGNGAGQAAHAHGVVGSGIPLMIDCETGPGGSQPQISDVVDFVNQYRALGGTTYLLYLPHWYWQGNLGQASLAPVIDLGMLLVSSDYTTYSDTGPGWAPYGGMTPVIWQYTSSATLNGVTPVDMNAYHGTLPDFQAQVTTGSQNGSEPTLVEGDTGPAVQTLQTRLNVWGAKLIVDGSFGPLTLAAVKAFQAEQNLTVDGIVGPQTWAALNKNPGPPPGPPPYPAPTGLAAGAVSLAVTWDAVTVNGQAVASYTVQAVGLNGQVYVHETPTTNSAVLSNLVAGWTYNVVVWANGGPGTPPSASITVTV